MKKKKSVSTKSSKTAPAKTKVNPTLLNLLYVMIVITLCVVAYKSFAPAPQPPVPQEVDINVITPVKGGADGSLSIGVRAPSTNEGKLDLDYSETYQVVLDGGKIEAIDNQVVGASLELFYNPKQLEVTEFQAVNSFLPTTMAGPTTKVVSSTKTLLSLSLATPPADPGKTGAGVIATFRVKPLTDGELYIDFDKGSSIRAVNVTTNGGNVLKTANKFKFTTPARYVSDIVYGVDAQGNNLNGRTENDPIPNFGKVNVYDYNLYVSNFGKTVKVKGTVGDFDKNGKIDIADYPIFVREWGF